MSEIAVHQFPSCPGEHPEQIIKSWLQAKQTALEDPSEVKNTVNTRTVLACKKQIEIKSSFRLHHINM